MDGRSWIHSDDHEAPFETPDDLKGDAFDQLGERMTEMDELNRTWKQNNGDITKMWKQGYLDSYDTGLMKHSDFDAQQTALKNKYYIQDPNPGARYGLSREQTKQIQTGMQKAQDKFWEASGEVMGATGKLMGAGIGVITDPGNPAKWTKLAGAVGETAMDMGGYMYGGLMRDILGNVPGAEGVADVFDKIDKAYEHAGQQIGQTADHWAMEMEI